MPMNRLRRLATAAVLASAAVVVVAQPASAQEQPFARVFPAGQACEDFPVGIRNPEGPDLRREFTDRNGNTVQLFAGRSGAISYTNTKTGETVSFNARGTRLLVTENPDGTLRLEYSGQVGLIQFPGDVPPGPFISQISGRLVANFNPEDESGEVLEVRGRQIDVCAELAPSASRCRRPRPIRSSGGSGQRSPVAAHSRGGFCRSRRAPAQGGAQRL